MSKEIIVSKFKLEDDNAIVDIWCHDSSVAIADRSICLTLTEAKDLLNKLADILDA